MRSRGRNTEAPGLWNGKVGDWRMLQGGGNTLYDISGFDNHGTLTNGPTWETTEKGWALDFANVTQQVQLSGVPSNFGAGYAGDLTFLHWINPPVLSAFMIVCDIVDRELSLFIGTSKYYGLGRTTASWTLAAGKSDFVADEWQLAGLQKQGASAHVIRNAEIINNAASAGTTFSNSPLSLNGKVSGGSTTNLQYHGSACLYDRALTPSERQQIYEDPDAAIRPRKLILPTAVAPGPGGNAPTGNIYGSLVGPLGGAI